MFGTYRTLLALLVVATHLGGVPNIGAYAVFGFYCLSGYLMTLILQTSYGYSVSGITKYGVNRFLRIYPIYWVSVLFSVALVWYLGKSFTTSYFWSIYIPTELSGIIKNILLFFTYKDSPRLIPPAWALTVEIIFYIFIGLGLSKTKRITVLWFIFSIVYHLIVFIFQLGWDHRYFTIFAASLPFSTGAMIYYYRQECIRYTNFLSGWMYRFLPYFLFFAIIINWWLGIKINQSLGLLFYINFILCAIMVAVLLDRKKLPFISKKFDKWMGDFSYPIYLTHYQIGLLVIVIFSAFGFDLKRPNLILMFASIPLLFIFSWLVTVSLERPIEFVRTKIKTIGKLK